MSEVLPGIHQVEGVDPSPDFSTHVYLVKDKGDRWILIDTGLPGSAPKIEAYLRKQSIPPSSISAILLTHLHRDHTGSLAAAIAATRAKSYAHWLEAAFIACDPPYDGPGSPPAEPVQVDEKLKDGDRLDLAGGIVAYHTPGHTPGHTAYYLPERKVLFSGDLFFGEGKRLLLTPKEYTHHTGTAQVSARRVATLPVDAVMTYHGGPLLTGGGAAVQQLVRGFSK